MRTRLFVALLVWMCGCTVPATRSAPRVSRPEPPKIEIPSQTIATYELDGATLVFLADPATDVMMLRPLIPALGDGLKPSVLKRFVRLHLHLRTKTHGEVELWTQLNPLMELEKPPAFDVLALLAEPDYLYFVVTDGGVIFAWCIDFRGTSANCYQFGGNEWTNIQAVIPLDRHNMRARLFRSAAGKLSVELTEIHRGWGGLDTVFEQVDDDWKFTRVSREVVSEKDRQPETTQPDK